MSKLRIADDFSLPVDFVTQTAALLAKRRAGKSYLAMKLVEQLWHAKQQVVVLDPKGDSWGLRSSADGRGDGLPIVILGGEHGDVKLEPSAGEVVARLVVEDRVSAILDLSELRKHEVATFCSAFLETLYRLKAREQYRTAMMLVIDEADAVAPQRPMRGEERMLGAAEDIVRRGGQRGIGCIMATQRAAVLNKNVLTQVQVLISLRTIAPQDLEAMNAWVDVHGTTEQRRELMTSLPALPVGTAWFWSPGWPTEHGIFQRVQVGKRETLDSGATPKAGQAPVEPKRVADVDLSALTTRMAATIERAKADDPKELRNEIAKLKRELAAKPATPAAEMKTVEKPVLDDKAVASVERLLDKGDKLVTKLQAQAGEVLVQAKAISDAMHHLREGFSAAQRWVAAGNTAKPTVTACPPPRRPETQRAVVRMAAHVTGQNGDSKKLAGGERKILTVLARYPHGKPKAKLGVLAGYAHSGGGFNNYLGALRSRGLVTGGADLVQITDAGIDALGPLDPLPTGRELFAYWCAQLGRAEREILAVLVEVYPQALTKEDAAARTPSQYESSGGGFNNALGRLRTLELIQGRGDLKASDDLFD